MSKGQEVMGEFWDLLNKMIWLDKYKMKVSLKGYKPSEVHCIDFIGTHAEPNVTKLAEAFYMTSGAMSKITKKLMERGLIESYKKPENKKEIYFRLTEQGEAVYRIHEDLHKEFGERDKAVFDQISDEQFDSMIHFAKLYGKHLEEEIEKLGVDVRTECYDRL